jgi:hypothetical protein
VKTCSSNHGSMRFFGCNVCDGMQRMHPERSRQPHMRLPADVGELNPVRPGTWRARLRAEDDYGSERRAYGEPSFGVPGVFSHSIRRQASP